MWKFCVLTQRRFQVVVNVMYWRFILFGPSTDVSERGVTPGGTHVKRANTVSFPD